MSLLVCMNLFLACTGTAGGRPDGETGLRDPAVAEETTWYRDDDRDGFGNPEELERAAAAPFGYVADGSDCDDGNTEVYPGAAEVCNGSDDDCDGEVDDGLSTATWYLDTDSDGWGDDASAVQHCMPPTGYTSMSGDCDDTDEAIRPDAEDICENGIDEDCADGDTRCVPEGGVSLHGADIKYRGGSPGDRAGAWLACGGDADGDDRGDLFVGETEQFSEEFSGSAGAGGAWLISSPTPGQWQLDEGPVSVWGEPSLSFESAFFVDLNSDGLDDAVLGSSVFYGPLAGHRVISASDSVLVHDYESLGVGTSGGTSLGPGRFAVAGTGNLYRDGRWGAAVGAVFVFESPLSGAVSTDEAVAALYPSVDHEYGYFGWSMCNGDVDGDGVLDLVVGAPSIYPTSYPDFMSFGVAYVVHGPFWGDMRMAEADGSLADADARIQGSGSAFNVGYAVDCGGDSDGDGLDDILLGAPDWSGAWEGGRGDAILFQSPVEGVRTVDEATARITGAAEGDYLGISVTLDGDLDGDGRDDVVVGSFADVGRGGAYAFYGSLSGLIEPSSADSIWVGEADDDFAAMVESCPDLDGDGIDDLVVGAPGESSGGTWSGAAYVVFGGGM